MQKRKPYKAKGAVLIMVLTIMFVLIFLLAGSVAVVYSSNRRVMIQYEESQAYYTARSVLDIFHEMILSDETGAATGTYYILEEDPTTHVLSEQGKTGVIKSGRALELDLYRVPVAVGIDPAVPETYNDYLANAIKSEPAYQALSTDADKEAYYKKYIVSRNLLNAAGSDGHINETAFQNYNKQYAVSDTFASRVKNGTDNTSGAESNKGVRAGIDDTLVYYVNTNDDLTQSNFKQYTGLYDDGSSNKLADNESLVKIYVQVLDRHYDFKDMATAGDYAGLNDLVNANPTDDITWQYEFNGGTRNRDYFVIKVTTEVVYDGEPVTTSAIFSSVDKPYKAKKGPSKAVVSMSDISGSNSVGAFGGGSSLARGNGLKWQNNLNTEGDIFINSSVDSGTNQIHIYLDGESSFFCRGTFTTQMPALTTNYIKEGALLYANKLFLKTSNGKVGDETNPLWLNVAGNTLEINDDCNNNHIVNCKGFFDTIKYGAPADYMGKKLLNGAYYCNWLYVQAANKPGAAYNKDAHTGIEAIAGAMETGSKITVYQGVKVYSIDGYGNLNVDETWNCDGNTYTCPDGGGSIEFKTGAGSIKTNYDGALGTDYNMETIDGMPYRVFDLPTNLSGHATTDTKLKLPTVQGLYSTYFNDTGTDGSDTWDTTGNGDFKLSVTAWEDPDQLSDFVSKHVKTAKEMCQEALSVDIDNPGFSSSSIGVYNKSSYDFYSQPGYTGYEDFDGVISGNYILHGDTNEGTAAVQEKKYLVDTTGGDVNLVLGSASENTNKKTGQYGKGMIYVGVFCVYGDNDLNIIVPCGTGGTVNSYTETVYPAWPDPPYDVTKYWYGNCVSFGYDQNHRFLVYDADVGVNPPTVTISRSNPTASTPSPNINYYISDNLGEVDIRSQGLVDSIIYTLSGYINSPNTVFMAQNLTGLGGNKLDIVTDDFPVGTDKVDHYTSPEGVSVFGSVLCKRFETGSNKTAALYIPNGNSGGGGGPADGDPLYKWPSQYYSMQ